MIKQTIKNSKNYNYLKIQVDSEHAFRIRTRIDTD